MKKNTTVAAPKTAHTPGPWHSVGTGVLGPEAKLKDSIAVVSTRLRNGIGLAKWPDEEREANARLIAAAPELLAALKAIKERASGNIYNTDQVTGEKFAVMVDAAIAKATGEGK